MMMKRTMLRWIQCGAVAFVVVALCGCESKSSRSTTSGPAREVVVYCSVDRIFAEPLLNEFAQESGIDVIPRYDTEAGKTTGLVNKLRAEKSQPRADVWWSSELFGTIELANAGVLARYRPTTAKTIPDLFVDPDGYWTAFGLRGRVIAYNPKRTQREGVPKTWADLAMPQYKGRVAMADPRFGTTRGHFASMLSEWGEDAFEAYLKGLKNNEILRADGNSHAVLLLAQGRVDFAATDTDDVIVAQQRGDSIAAAYPDMTSPDGAKVLKGTLWIPCSVAMINGARNPGAAKKLIDFIASARMETALNESESRNVPVRAKLRAKLGVADVEAAPVDYRAAAKAMKQSAALIDEIEPFRHN